MQEGDGQWAEPVGVGGARQLQAGGGGAYGEAKALRMEGEKKEGFSPGGPCTCEGLARLAGALAWQGRGAGVSSVSQLPGGVRCPSGFQESKLQAFLLPTS